MAALNFPTGPSVNDTYTANSKTYIWDGVSWLNKTVLGNGSLVLSGAGGWPSTTAGCTGPTLTESATNKENVYSLRFADSGAKQYAEWTGVMPPAYSGGTITAQFIWSASGTSTNSVVWGLAGRVFGDLETIDQSFGTAQEAIDAHSSTADQVQISAVTSAITLAGTPTAGKMVHFRAYRDSSSGSDTLAVTANLIAVLLTY
jgi:hypothetical protein